MDNLPVEIQGLLTQLLVAVTSLVVAVIGYYARQIAMKGIESAKLKIGEQQFNWLKSYIETSVHAASQNPLFEGWDGAKLKVWVIENAMLFIEKNNLPFDVKDVDTLIESAVKWMKYEYPILPENIE